MRYEIYTPDNDIYKINSIGYSKDVNITKFGPAQRNNYIIHYVISGQGYFNNCLVKAGQGFLITPQMLEHYSPDIKNPWEFIWIIFQNSPIVSRLFEEYHADPNTNIFHYRNISLFSEIKNLIMKNNSKMFRASELFELYLHILNHQNIFTERKSSAENLYYNHAIQFINMNIYRKITVTELTVVLGVSQPYLYKVFKNTVGISPKQYIDARKIAKAKELLLSSYMSLTEIANSIGLNDCIEFSKFFKKHVGISPSKYTDAFCGIID